MKTKLFFLTLTVAAICLWAAANALAVPQYAITDLGLLPSLHYAPADMGALVLNNAGQVAGGDGHAFLWSGGKKTDLGVLPPEGIEDFAHSVAYGINNRGQVVGSSGSFGAIFMSGLVFSRGFLYQNGRLRQLTQRNSSFEPYAINNKGQIAGNGTLHGQPHDFLLTPR